MKSIRRISKNRKTKKYTKKLKGNLRRFKKGNLGKALRGGEGEMEELDGAPGEEGRSENGGGAPVVNRRSKNDSKIRIQFLNPRATTTPRSIISVLKGPSTGVFDYMWYNINDIEEMLSTAMYGLKEDPPLPSEIVYNVKHNDKSDDTNKESEEEDKPRKNRYDSDPFDAIR